MELSIATLHKILDAIMASDDEDAKRAVVFILKTYAAYNEKTKGLIVTDSERRGGAE